MSTTQILVLGALAGFTIFLGLPVGRIRSTDTRLKAALSAAATGILLFLFWDVIVHGIEPVENALDKAHEDGGSWFDFVKLAVTFGAGMSVGLMSLVYYDRWFGRQRSKAMLGPGAASAAEFDRSWVAGLSPAAWLAFLIATGIGLHNATEGFGIVAPLSGSETRPSWKFLALLGLIGGGPTFVGTLLGQTWVNETVSVAFLALAAGSILYVVIQLMNVNQKLGHKTLVGWMLLAGLFAGFATDFIIEAAGV